MLISSGGNLINTKLVPGTVSFILSESIIFVRLLEKLDAS